jgi:hypothetical protein
MGTTQADPRSIMCYEILGQITNNRQPTRGGTDITRKDYAFAAKVYPKSRTQPTPPRILVAAAQPAGFDHLSSEQEVDVIRRGFLTLEDVSLAKVESARASKVRGRKPVRARIKGSCAGSDPFFSSFELARTQN